MSINNMTIDSVHFNWFRQVSSHKSSQVNENLSKHSSKYVNNKINLSSFTKD